MNMNIAYVRVSSLDQNEGRQLEALKQFNIEKWFIEKVSAKDMNRPQLQEMLDFVRNGDVVYIHDFSRLARRTKDLLNIVELLNSKSVSLISNKEKLDTSTATGKLMLTVIAAISEFERQNLLERQAEGIALAKEQGKYKGRKQVDFPDNWNEVFEQYQNRDITAIEAMKLLGLKRNTFYNLIKRCNDI